MQSQRLQLFQTTVHIDGQRMFLWLFQKLILIILILSRLRKRDLEQREVLLRLNQTVRFRDMYLHLQHGRNLNHTKYALQHIRLFQVPERTSRIGQKWLETSSLTLVEKKKRVKSSHLRFWDRSRMASL